ncbi:Nn.00g028280.m01.CDS01 [Neocucurbitaria sp. VM-36]
MDLPASIESTPSTTLLGSPYHAPPQPQPHNPYARISSRRAIACVTCAKAKTKCDKALPSCSRCITKGIKCDPRSTRRTSDNSYRANVKKPLVSPKRYHTTGTVPSLNRQTSLRGIPSPSRQRAMRAASSHIDFRTAVKPSQQPSGVSGYPMLTPLPTYTSHIVDECYSYSSSPEQNMVGYTQTIDMNAFPSSGRLTPQTPEPIIYHEPLTTGGILDPYITSQPWSDEVLGSAGLDFDPDMTAIIPINMWSAPEPAHIMPMAQMSWPQSSFSVSPSHMSAELVSHASGAPSLTTSECSVEDFNTSGTNAEEWSIYQPTATQINMADLVTSAAFMHDMKSIPSHAPIWEDVFIPSSSPY